MSEPQIRALLYRAIRELAYIQEVEGLPPGIGALVNTAEGFQIVQQGMRALGVKDLSKESFNELAEGDHV